MNLGQGKAAKEGIALFGNPLNGVPLVDLCEHQVEGARIVR